jgi:polyphosphate kinase
VTKQILGVTLADNAKARSLRPDGAYRRLAPKRGQKTFRSQFEFIGLSLQTDETRSEPVDGKTRFPKVKVAPRPAELDRGR